MVRAVEDKGGNKVGGAAQDGKVGVTKATRSSLTAEPESGLYLV